MNEHDRFAVAGDLVFERDSVYAYCCSRFVLIHHFFGCARNRLTTAFLRAPLAMVIDTRIPWSW